MSLAMKAKAGVLMLLGALSAVTYFVHTAQIHSVLTAVARGDFAISVSPATKSVPKGAVATYAVTMTPGSGYSKTVTLSAKVPSLSGATAFFAPATVSGSSRTATLYVGTNNAHRGTWSITVTGTDTKLRHTASAKVTITASNQQYTLGATPSSATMLPGATRQLGVALTRKSGYTTPVSLVVRGAPSGVTTSFSPANPVKGNSSTLQVASTSSVPSGTYALTISGFAGDSTTQTTTVQLVINGQGADFGITGAPTGQLVPGAAASPVNLTLTNPNDQALNVTNLTMTLTGTSAGSACGASNFELTQFGGTYPLALAANQTATLQGLGIAQLQWPTVRLINDPIHNQDACKNVTLNLVYSGAGQG